MNLLGAAQLADICFEIDPSAQQAEAVRDGYTRRARHGFDKEQFERLLVACVSCVASRKI